MVAARKVLDVLARHAPALTLLEVVRDKDVDAFVRAATFLAASVQDDRAYADALGDQIVAASELEKGGSPCRMVRRRILSPLVFLGGAGIALWSAWLVLRSQRRWFAKLWAVVLAASFLVILWAAVACHLISFHSGY